MENNQTWSTKMENNQPWSTKKGKEEKIILSCMEPNFLFKGYFMYFLYVLICPDFLII